MSVDIRYMANLDACAFKKFEAVGDTVELVEHYAAYSALYYKLGAFKAW